ncbi:ornithine carbamoyltransferase [Demequina lutea]|uniref:Ornithine carbamoyltransferase n=1 Tax=Demequina lutea TaxID=431489 RepID=A0A7Z0CJ81_9MICO|nr:ornithine carbamoyltransferase [Demequina lutea]NYI42749.1 ornithine carbamoyltransferase [Demequina lutea]
MAVNLHGRSFVKELDFTRDEMRLLLDISHDLKRAKYAGTERPRLSGKNIALIFEKPSTRTRSSFEVAAHDQGAHVTYLGPEGSHMGKTESMKDTARVLGRLFDGIEYRGFAQSTVETLAAQAGVPVWNGLTDKFHPTQTLCDVFTMEELSRKPAEQITLAYVGDAHQNMGNSLMVMGALMGLDLRLGAPRQLWPEDDLIKTARGLAEASGGSVTITEDPAAAVKGADFVYTDVWLSMGEEESAWQERIEQLQPYQVNAKLMKATGNDHARFLHCLPSFHNRDTTVGEHLHEKFSVDALEVTDEVFESAASAVFIQAENRMHTIKAVLVATLGS